MNEVHNSSERKRSRDSESTIEIDGGSSEGEPQYDQRPCRITVIIERRTSQKNVGCYTGWETVDEIKWESHDPEEAEDVIIDLKCVFADGDCESDSDYEDIDDDE